MAMTELWKDKKSAHLLYDGNYSKGMDELETNIIVIRVFYCSLHVTGKLNFILLLLAC